MATTTGTTLLVIDTNPETAEFVRGSLAEYQAGRFVVVGAADADAALAAVPDPEVPSLALVFQRQGGSDGLRAIAALRERIPRLAVILVTDQRDFGALVHAMRLQVDDHIVREEALAPALPRIIAAAIERTRLTGRIEEQRKAELFARRKADAVRELIVTVCHEFNNPLAAIKISTDILARQELTSADRALVDALSEGIQRIEVEINRLRRVGIDAAGVAGG